VVLRGLEHAGLGCVWVAPGPYDVSTSCGHSTDVPAFRRSDRRPSLDLRSSSECVTGNPCRPAGFPAGRTTRPLLNFFCPTTQSQASGYVSRQQIALLPRCHVRGLATPFAALPPALPTLTRRSVHGLHPSRCSLRRKRCPSRGPYPPAVTRFLEALPGTRPKQLHLETQPASGPCSCDESVQSPESRMIPAVDTFLGFDPPEHSPARPDARFESRRLPSRPQAA